MISDHQDPQNHCNVVEQISKLSSEPVISKYFNFAEIAGGDEMLMTDCTSVGECDLLNDNFNCQVVDSVNELNHATDIKPQGTLDREARLLPDVTYPFVKNHRVSRGNYVNSFLFLVVSGPTESKWTTFLQCEDTDALKTYLREIRKEKGNIFDNYCLADHTPYEEDVSFDAL